MQRLASKLLGSAALAGLSLHTGAQAADLPARPVAPTPYVAAVPAFTWTGFYVGVNAGYGFGNSGGFNDPTYGTVTGPSGGNGGFVGGGQVGFNYQLTPGSGFVFGLEADLQAAKLGSNSATYVIGSTPYYDVGSSLDWFGTVRGRLGYAFDRLLVYGTAGFAYGGGSTNTSYASIYPHTFSDSTRTGYAAGGGVEYAFTPNITGKIEGLYVKLDRGNGGSTYYETGTNAYYGTGRTQDDFGAIRAGLNYKFSSF
jgi:outer membrane immunogenic protein